MTAKDTTSRRLEGRGMQQTSKTFRRARLVLTAWYAVGVFILLALFNLFIYFIFTQRIHIEEEGDGAALVIESESDEDHGFDDDGDEGSIIADFGDEKSIDDDLLVAQAFASGLIMLFVVILASILSRKTLRPIEESYERQERFIADAAHELRTPLTVMRAGAEVALSREQSPASYRTFIADMLEESRRLSKLSDDLLMLARGVSNKAVFETIDLGTIIGTMCDVVRPYAQKKNLTLLYQGVASPITVNGVASDIQRALMNVITNAVDYTSDGGVTITLTQEAGHALIRVADTGIGIASADIPLVFDRFYKADTSRGARENGAGLGLAIVKEIVERHGGSVAVESQTGHGTTVTLRFPLVS
ncbi:MAG: two-component system, OmpR family, heavy metal sensor histidine kinase CusS [Patescibacteria group bacterium]|nr:two-component system, OmpR family, heavy metal sensor histidine kinase CusS [Patescibacteria group bacterium]